MEDSLQGAPALTFLSKSDHGSVAPGHAFQALCSPRQVSLQFRCFNSVVYQGMSAKTMKTVLIAHIDIIKWIAWLNSELAALQ